MSTASIGISPLLAAVVVALVAITGSYGCPDGCECHDYNQEAICSLQWLGRSEPVFPQSINSLELKYLPYEFMMPYLSGATGVRSLTIYPSSKLPRDHHIPHGFFDRMPHLESLTIHDTENHYIPRGLARVIAPVETLKVIDFTNNRMHCDCTLPTMLLSKSITIKRMTRMPPVRGCHSKKGFEAGVYSVEDFLQICETQRERSLDQDQAASGDETQVRYASYTELGGGNEN